VTSEQQAMLGLLLVEWILIWSLILEDLKFEVNKNQIFIVLDLIFYNWVERSIMKLFLVFQ